MNAKPTEGRVASRQKTHAAHLGESEAKKPTSSRLSLDELDENAFLRLNQIVPALVPIHRSTWWSWVRSGYAPAGRKLGPATTAWQVRDLRAFLAQRSAT